jgi:hypothetical protein
VARAFNQANGDYIDFDSGNVGVVDGGPETVAVLWRPNSVHTGMLVTSWNQSGYTTTGYEAVNDGKLYALIGGNFTETAGYTAEDCWRIDVWTKANLNNPVQFYSLIWDGGTWVPGTGASLGDTTTTPVDTLRVGRDYSGNTLDGDVAAVMVLQRQLTSEQVQTLSDGMFRWVQLAAGYNAAVYRFNQESVATDVVDVSGGGADQVAISGTSVTDDPPGWVYDLYEPVVVNSVTMEAPALSWAGTITTVPPYILPDSEVVAVAWLGSSSCGITTDMVSTKLPRDTSRWYENGFITIGDGTGRTGGVIGGTVDLYTQMRNPVLSIHVWGVNPTSDKPPWRKASQLAQRIIAMTQDETTIRRAIQLPPGYYPVRVDEAAVLGEPRRLPGDPGSYAHYSLDLRLHWVRI